MITIKFRRGLASSWETYNPVLRAGEPGVAIDANVYKIGDGVTRWADLPAYPNEAAVQAAIAESLGGITIADHLVDPTPHPAYDDLPSLVLLFENGLT